MAVCSALSFGMSQLKWIMLFQKICLFINGNAYSGTNLYTIFTRNDIKRWERFFLTEHLLVARFFCEVSHLLSKCLISDESK